MIERPNRFVNRASKGDGGHGPLMLNIRVRRVKRRGMPAAEDADVLAALQTLLDTGKMPRGWQFMAVNWKNPRKFGNSWDTGWPSFASTEDADEFREAFARAVQARLRLAEVRRV